MNGSPRAAIHFVQCILWLSDFPFFLRYSVGCVQLEQCTYKECDYPLVPYVGEHKHACSNKRYAAKLLLEHESAQCDVASTFAANELHHGKEHCTCNVDV